jgi:hypothetical protein
LDVYIWWGNADGRGMVGESETDVRKSPVVIAGICALVTFVLLFPACGSTEIGIPPGKRDPNEASCDTILFDYPPWGHTPGNEPGTSESFTSYDLVWRRSMIRAAIPAAAFLLLGLIVGWVTGKRRKDPPAS